MENKLITILFCLFMFSPLEAVEENQGWPVDWGSGQGCLLVIDFDGDGAMDVVTGKFNPELGA